MAKCRSSRLVLLVPVITYMMKMLISLRILLVLLLLACASGSQAVKDVDMEGVDYGFEGTSKKKMVWVRGPWEKIKPSRDIDDVIDQLCPAVMDLPGARDGDYGREYCGVIYKLLSEDQYYASKPSSLMDPTLDPANKHKTCLTPTIVKDSRGVLERKGDYHGHPWASSMSSKDRLRVKQWYMFRIQFDTLCRVQKLIAYVDDNRPGELYERQGKSWKLIGYILPEDKDRGYVTPVGQ